MRKNRDFVVHILAPCVLSSQKQPSCKNKPYHLCGHFLAATFYFTIYTLPCVLIVHGKRKFTMFEGSRPTKKAEMRATQLLGVTTYHETVNISKWTTTVCAVLFLSLDKAITNSQWICCWHSILSVVETGTVCLPINLLCWSIWFYLWFVKQTCFVLIKKNTGQWDANVMAGIIFYTW